MALVEVNDLQRVLPTRCDNFLQLPLELSNTVKLWSIDGKELQTLKGHRSFVWSVAFSPDDKSIASASGDKPVILWNLDLDDLMAQGCAWLRDYLVNNPNATDEEREACQVKR